MITISTTAVQLRMFRSKTERRSLTLLDGITIIGKSINKLKNLEHIGILSTYLKQLPIDFSKISNPIRITFFGNENGFQPKYFTRPANSVARSTYFGREILIKYYYNEQVHIAAKYFNERHEDYRFKEGGVLTSIEIIKTK